MFSKKQRIAKKEDFAKIYKHGYRYSSNYFYAFILKNNLNYNRYTVVVSKKISPLAVKRNKIKRKLRYALSSLQIEFPQNLDIIINITHLDIMKIKSAILKNELSNLSKKLKIRA